MHLTPLQIKLNSLTQTFKDRELLDNTRHRSRASSRPRRKRIKKNVSLVKLSRNTRKNRTRPYKILAKYSRKRSVE